jgi:thiamine-monophosphate kinase
MNTAGSDTLGELGEQRILARLGAFARNHEHLQMGIGDDSAVTSAVSGDHQVFTSDATLEGIHFETGEIPERIGNKAVGRVLSDIAAMGAHPEWILINVTAPASMEIATLEKVYAGIADQLERCGGTLIGGDLSEGTSFALHVFASGRVPAGRALLRKGAQVGDLIWSTGALGGSRTGKHLDFIPRVQAGVWLQESGLVHSMMDVTDGLAQDLAHLCEASGVGACVDASVLEEMSSVEAALYDGEDFELLFTSRAADRDQLIARWQDAFAQPLWHLGVVTEQERGIHLSQGHIEKPIEVRGNQHYRSVE